MSEGCTLYVLSHCVNLHFALMSLMLDSHLHNRRDNSLGMYQLYQLERTIEFELKSRIINRECRSQWPRRLRRRSVAARLLRSWVRIPPGAWIFVCCECCVLSGKGLCDELITRPEESYRLWCVVVCDLETSRMRRPWPALGRKNYYYHYYYYVNLRPNGVTG